MRLELEPMASSLIARLSARGVRGRLPIATAATTAIAPRRLLSQQGKADYSEAGTSQSQSQSGNTIRHLVLASGCLGLAAAASSLLIPNHELAHKQTQEEEPHSSSKVTTVEQEAEERRRKLQAFASWLRESGADVEGLCFEEVPEMESEVGLFSKRRVPALGRAQRWAARVATLGFGGREHPVARIPLAGVALTPATPLRDENPDVTALFESALSSGDLDPREAVVLYLILEHRRGEKSKWQRYLDVLPAQPAPLLSASDLSDLRGTTLHRAATSFRRRLPERFREDLCPLLDKILDLAGLGGARDRVSYPEFARFYSAFWSRAIALPLRAPSETGEETLFQVREPENSWRGRASCLASRHQISSPSLGADPFSFSRPLTSRRRTASFQASISRTTRAGAPTPGGRWTETSSKFSPPPHSARGRRSG